MIQEVSSNALLLHLLVRLCSNWFLGVSSLLHLIINSNLLITSLLISSSVIIGPIELVEILLHHGGVRCLEVARRRRLWLELEEIRTTCLRDLNFVI